MRLALRLCAVAVLVLATVAAYPGAAAAVVDPSVSFTTPAYVQVTEGDSRISSIAAADFNRDGHSDIAVISKNYEIHDATLTIFQGSSVAGVAPISASNVTFKNKSIFGRQSKVVEANGDGIPDIAVTATILNSEGRVTGQNAHFVLINRGDGTFPSEPSLSSPILLPWDVFAHWGDYSGDGKADVVFSSRNGVQVHFGTGNGTFQQVAARGPFTGREYDGSWGYYIVTGDFNRDGLCDILISDAELLTFLSNGDGTFREGPRSMLPPLPPVYISGPYQVSATGDFDGNGTPDVVVQSKSDLRVLLGTGNGAFSPVSAVVPGGSAQYFPFVGAGDFNSDGKPDIAAVWNTAAPPRGGGGPGLYIVIGNGDGTFQFASFPQECAGKSSASCYIVGTELTVFADVNGDGRVDVIAATGQRLQSFLNTTPRRTNAPTVTGAMPNPQPVPRASAPPPTIAPLPPRRADAPAQGAVGTPAMREAPPVMPPPQTAPPPPMPNPLPPRR